MRFMWAALLAFTLSSPPAFSGGMSGGTGIGGVFEQILQALEKLLKQSIDIDAEEFRRILMRLCVYGEAEIKIGDKTILIKWKVVHAPDGTQTIEVMELHR